MPRNGSAAGSPARRHSNPALRGKGSRGGAGRTEGVPAAKPASRGAWLLPHLQPREAAAGGTTQQDIRQPGPWRCAAAAVPVAGMPAAAAPVAAAAAVPMPRVGMPAAASRALKSAAANRRIGARIPPARAKSAYHDGSTLALSAAGRFAAAHREIPCRDPRCA